MSFPKQIHSASRLDHSDGNLHTSHAPMIYCVRPELDLGLSTRDKFGDVLARPELDIPSSHRAASHDSLAKVKVESMLQSALLDGGLDVGTLRKGLVEMAADDDPDRCPLFGWVGIQCDILDVENIVNRCVALAYIEICWSRSVERGDVVSGG